MEKIPLFDCVETEKLTAKGQPKKIKTCPYCHKKGIAEEISTRDEKFGAVPVLVSYLCENGCKPARSERRHNDNDTKKREYFEKFDLAKLKEIEAKEIPYWYPDAELAKVIPYRMLYKKDFRPTDAKRLIDLFTKRNLWALAVIMKTVKNNDILRFCGTAILSYISKQQPAFGGGGGISGTFYLPQITSERHVMESYERKVTKVIEAKRDFFINTQFIVSCQSAINLLSISECSVDHIFTDPPYADKVQYGELAFPIEAWLGFDTTWHDDEIIVNEVRGKTEKDWADMMRQAMGECYRALKPGRCISLCYHDTSEGTWALIQDIWLRQGLLWRSLIQRFILTQGRNPITSL